MEKTRQTELRLQFRTAVFQRDGYRCCCCGRPGQDRQGGTEHKRFHAHTSVVLLDAHHITERHLMPNGGYVAENGISLCDDCHKKAELAYYQPRTEPQFTVSRLYQLIRSSYEKACSASQQLDEH